MDREAIAKQISEQAQQLNLLQASNPSRCVLGRCIAVADSDVQKLITDKAIAGQIVTDVSCLGPDTGDICNIFFKVDRIPPLLSLVGGSFLVEVDVARRKVARIIDPYLENTVRILGSVTIPPDQIDGAKLRALYDLLLRTSSGGGTSDLQMTDLLAIVSFPPDVEERIRLARGAVAVRECQTLGPRRHRCKATNNGSRVEEDIPGSGGLVGIIIEPAFSCTFEVIEEETRIDVSNITGLIADPVGPFNPPITRIDITVPAKQVILYY